MYSYGQGAFMVIIVEIEYQIAIAGKYNSYDIIKLYVARRTMPSLKMSFF